MWVVTPDTPGRGEGRQKPIQHRGPWGHGDAPQGGPPGRGDAGHSSPTASSLTRGSHQPPSMSGTCGQTEPPGGIWGLAVEAISTYRTRSTRDPVVVLATGCFYPRLEGQRGGGYRGPRPRVTLPKLQLQREATATGEAAGGSDRDREAGFSLAPRWAPTRAHTGNALGSGAHSLRGQAFPRVAPSDGSGSSQAQHPVCL